MSNDPVIKNPTLALIKDEFHTELNDGLTLEELLRGSGKRKVHWKCSLNAKHVWPCELYRRLKGSGCPYCSGYAVNDTNSLEAMFPEIACQWDKERNKGVLPSEVYHSSYKSYFWKCDQGPDHMWSASTNSRTNSNGACPFCTNLKVSVTNSLLSKHPEIAEEWHVKKNGDLSPSQVVFGSAKRVWWQCRKNRTHIWNATVSSRTKGGNKCPECITEYDKENSSLQAKFPQIALEWDHHLNTPLSPSEIHAGSSKKVWWRCRLDSAHSWQTSVSKRTNAGSGCPDCAGKRVSPDNSLAAKFPEIGKQFYSLKNSGLNPHEVTAFSSKKVWWKCEQGEDHIWDAVIASRTRRGQGCPYCDGRKLSTTNSLAGQHPSLAKYWDTEKNIKPDPALVLPNKKDSYWWKCCECKLESIKQKISKQQKNPFLCKTCAPRKVEKAVKKQVQTPKDSTNSLLQLFPEIASQWHPVKNGDLTPSMVLPGSNKKVWWKCDAGPDHEWQQIIHARTIRGFGCRACANRQLSVTNSLKTLFPEIAAQWHPTKNGVLTPEKVKANDNSVVWWKCLVTDDHEWSAKIKDRAKSKGECPFCIGQRVSESNSLSSQYPDIAAEWHPTKNGDLTPDMVVAGARRKVWWKCPNGDDHEWEAHLVDRTRLGQGCRRCNKGWTVATVRTFIESIRPFIDAMTPAELFVLFQQAQFGTVSGKTRSFIKALTTGRFPTEEIDKFIAKEDSLVDAFIEDTNLSLEQLETLNKSSTQCTSQSTGEEFDPERKATLPALDCENVLAALDNHVVANADEEAVEFLISSSVGKLWMNCYRDEKLAIDAVEAFSSESAYPKRTKERFLTEYQNAKNTPLPEGYKFEIGGKPIIPNLMQKHLVQQVQNKRRVGNWSGTGAGKTLSAILASRAIGSKLTVICCPNPVVEGWKRTIVAAFDNSEVQTKTWTPSWKKSDSFKYLILNYETFQQPYSKASIIQFASENRIDFIVIDEIHFAKQRQSENQSLRRENVSLLNTAAAKVNHELSVLGLSATPVINNLYEGRSLIEMITGYEHEDLETSKASLANCMKMHQKVVSLGIRWMPNYSMELSIREISVSCEPVLDEIRVLGKSASTLQLESLLTQARLPTILSEIKPKTLIYSHYIKGIDKLLYDSISEAGWSVGFYTGEDKSGLERFIDGDLDVLIGSSAVSTGVDGLQTVCDKLIVNVLPWTSAEFEQLKGRIYRQGQTSTKVEIVIPLTEALVSGEKWSWCQSKMQRLAYKRSIADAVIDGVVPEGQLRTPSQAYKDAMMWLERLSQVGVQEVIRKPIELNLDLDSLTNFKEAKLARQYGDFSQMNHRWNNGRSDVTATRLARNPEEWSRYHQLYRKARESWAVIPYQEFIRWAQKRSSYSIGDFGCGEALVQEALSQRHTIYSFDHVAINEHVTACDMSKVPLDDESLDVALFSLSLMGSNYKDYLKEAYRCLKIDGQLHIWEATSREELVKGLDKTLKDLGFSVIEKNSSKFTEIKAIKT